MPKFCATPDKGSFYCPSYFFPRRFPTFIGYYPVCFKLWCTRMM